jgi:hypothetical protein
VKRSIRQSDARAGEDSVTRLLQLQKCGQSYWLDKLTRTMMRNGELQRRFREEGWHLAAISIVCRVKLMEHMRYMRNRAGRSDDSGSFRRRHQFALRAWQLEHEGIRQFNEALDTAHQALEEKRQQAVRKPAAA